MLHFVAPVHAVDAAYRQDLLPLRLRNAAGSLDTPLYYPANVAIPAQAPQTKQELMFLTGVCPFYQTFLLSNINYAIQVSTAKFSHKHSTSLLFLIMLPSHNAANK
jgi:hypothetical protein